MSLVALMAPDLGQLGEEEVAVEVDMMVVLVVRVLSGVAVVVVMVLWKVMFLEECVVALESVVFSVVVAVVGMVLDVVEEEQVLLL